MTAIAIPAANVVVDGAALAPALAGQLVGIRVASRLSAPAQCELAFAAWPASAGDVHPFPLGAALSVAVPADHDLLFLGEITAVEVRHGGDGEGTVRVRAYDQLHRLRKHQQTRVHESVTVADLARALVGDIGLDVITEEAGPRWDRLVQHRQTDLGLLVDVAGRAGLHVVSDGRALRLLTMAGAGVPVELALGVELLEATVEANLEPACREVTARSWVPQRAAAIEGRASSPRSGRSVAMEADPARVGSDGVRILVDHPAAGEDHVTAAAQAELDHRAAAELVLSGLAEGDARIKAGCRLAVRGLADGFGGTYVVTEAVHTLDGAGYLSRFSTAPPPPEAHNGAAAVTLGTVTAVDDPDGWGRVRVTLPTLGDVDAGWLPVVAAGAGAGKGLVALPGVDDAVLVALPHGEPGEGIVIGGLFGAQAPPDTGVDDGAVKRWSMRTAGGQIVVVDDVGDRLRLENSRGSFVELAPDRVRIHANCDLVIEAPGHKLTVRADAVDFQHAAGEEASDLAPGSRRG
ncbi:MAG: phage baseplate assembly protein V [Acidimicrobiia bacterium]